MRESCPGARWIRGQVEQLRGTVVVPRGWRGGEALREAHARQMIGRVEAPGNVHHSKFELRNGVEPASLMVAQRALLEEPLQARVVRT